MSGPTFTWTPEDRARLVKGATVTWFVQDDAGSIQVEHVSLHAGAISEGSWIFDPWGGKMPLRRCDPKTIKEPRREAVVLLPPPMGVSENGRALAQKFIQEAEQQMALARAVDRLDQLFSTKVPDFSVVGEEDAAAWALLRDTLAKRDA